MNPIHVGLSYMLVALIVIFTNKVSSSPPSFQHVTDECDWVDRSDGRGNNDPPRSIRPVSLRCSQGRIQWRYPGGALRVTLRLGTSGQRDFRGCVKAGNRFRGVRLYLEGHRTLHLLFVADDGRHPQLPRCFVSHRGQVVLYVEPEIGRGGGGGRGLNETLTAVAEFHYDLQERWKLPDQPRTSDTQSQMINNRSVVVPFDLESDCQPCNDEVLTQFYCTSDFAARGRILEVCENYDLERTEVKVGAWKVYKQPVSIFRMFKNRTLIQGQHLKHPLDVTVGHKCQSVCKHCEIGNTKSAKTRLRFDEKSLDPIMWMGVVHFPLICGVKYGPEEFLFLGHLLFDSPVVKCAPRWMEWQRARNRVRRMGRLQCPTP